VEALIRSLRPRLPTGYDIQLFCDETLQQTHINILQKLRGYRGLLAFPS
jgi:hypothetical protein